MRSPFLLNSFNEKPGSQETRTKKIQNLKFQPELRVCSILKLKFEIYLGLVSCFLEFTNEMAEYFRLGKLVAVHGLKGQLVLKHTLGKRSTLKDLKAIFIEEKKDSMLPWFITEVKSGGKDELLLRLEGIDVREKAMPLVQKEVWIPEEDYKRLSKKTAPANMLGYTVIDNQKPLGPILEVIEQPHQMLCRVDMQGKEVLIPLHENTLKRVNHAKKEVYVELPEGLLDVYL